MNTFLLVLALSVVLLAVGMLGMAFNIVFLKKRFPVTSVGHNKNMRKLGITCEKCDELKRCKPSIQKKKEEKEQRMAYWDQLMEASKL